MKKRGFLFFLLKSIAQRTGRCVTASVSVMLAVAVITGIAGLTYGIRDKLGTELASYGANIIVSPQQGQGISHTAVQMISALPDVISAEGQVYGRASVLKESVEVIGLDLEEAKNRGWRLYGRLPKRDGDILSGINLRDALSLAEGDSVRLAYEGRSMDFSISGFVESGSAEDTAFLMSVEDAWMLMGTNEKWSAVLVRGTAGELEMIADDIRETIPAAMVKTVRQVAVAEASLLQKIQLLMILVCLVVIFAAVVSVAGTVGATVIERRGEIGLMKALGGTGRTIRSFYLAESSLVGLVGGIDGFILGYLFAQAVSWKAFGSFISIPLYLVLFSVLTGLAIALFASHFPVRDALGYNAAEILKGE